MTDLGSVSLDMRITVLLSHHISEFTSKILKKNVMSLLFVLWNVFVYSAVLYPNEADSSDKHSVGPDQTAPLEQSDQGQHCLL